MGDLSTWQQLAPQIAVAITMVAAALAIAKVMQPKEPITRAEFEDLKEVTDDMAEKLGGINDTVMRLETILEERKAAQDRPSHA